MELKQKQWIIPPDVNDFQARQCKSGEFWDLYDLMIVEKSGFVYNRELLLDAFVDGQMYILEGIETDENYHTNARGKSIFRWCNRGMYTLPAFCVLTADRKVNILWVSKKARRQGISTNLLKKLNANTPASPILPESAQFWATIK